MVSPREQAELPYKGRSGEDEAAEEEALRNSSQRERKQGKSSREQSDCKGRRCLPTQLSERRMKGKVRAQHFFHIKAICMTFFVSKFHGTGSCSLGEIKM